MQGFRVFMRILTTGLSIYMLLIMFRILLTWFQGPNLGRPVEVLRSITDPYLTWFRRFEFLRIGNFDFSVIVAIILLSILASITNSLANAMQVTFGFVLALIIARVASAAGFFVFLFLALALIRLVGSLIGANTSTRFWITLDRILEPPVHKVAIKLSRGKFVAYQNALMLFSGLLGVVLIGGRYVVNGIVALATRIPF